MVKGASAYNPWRNPKSALERRNVVLKLLQTQEIIDQELYNVLSARPLGVKPRSEALTPQPAFMQLVRQELQTTLGDKVKDLSGTKIFTTLDPVSQDAAEKAVEVGVADIRKVRKIDDLEGAMVVVDRLSGEVRALVGGSQPQYAGFNRALSARRSIGSLAKPATYLTALSEPERFRLNTWLADEPISVPIPGGKPWQPRNYDRGYKGKLMLVDALATSRNIPTVNLGLEVGLDRVIQTWINLGAPAENLEKVPAMLLGALNLTPMEVAQTFQTIGSLGNRAKLSSLRSVIAQDGTVLYQSYPQAETTVSPQAAYMTLFGMQQVVNSGTAWRVLKPKFGNYNLAGKTGTTNDLRDSWFAGIDGKEVTISWMGRDNNGPTNLTGSTGALLLYRNYLENQAPLKLNPPAPEDIAEMSVDAQGNFACYGGGVRTLPVWTANPDGLCTPVQQDTDESGAPKWLQDLFSE